MSFGEEFVSGGRISVEVLHLAVCLVSDKIADCIGVSYDSVGR